MSKNQTSNKSKLYACICAVAVIIIVAIVIVVVVKNHSSDDNFVSNSNESNSSHNDSYSVTAAELSQTPDVTVSYGDYDAMKTLSKDIQNGRATDKIVKIDGLVSHPYLSYSIVQESSDGTEKFGTVFLITNASDSDYPEDESRITITAKVVEISPLNFQLVTLKDFIELKD